MDWCGRGFWRRPSHKWAWFDMVSATVGVVSSGTTPPSTVGGVSNTMDVSTGAVGGAC